MEITEVKVRHIKSANRLKAIASITIDNALAIHDIKIIEGEQGHFLAMPSAQLKDGSFRDSVHPVNAQTRKMIHNAVIEKYEASIIEMEYVE